MSQALGASTRLPFLSSVQQEKLVIASEATPHARERVGDGEGGRGVFEIGGLGKIRGGGKGGAAAVSSSAPSGAPPQAASPAENSNTVERRDANMASSISEMRVPGCYNF